MNELIETYKSYIQLLTDELNEAVGMAAVHGWKSTRYEEGVKLREKIAELSSIKVVGEEKPKLEGKEIKTLAQCKDEIAKKYGKESWYIWGFDYSEPYGKSIPEKYLDEAANLFENQFKLTVPTPPLQVEITKEEILEKFGKWLAENFTSWEGQDIWQNIDEEKPIIKIVNGKDIFTFMELYNEFLRLSGGEK